MTESLQEIERLMEHACVCGRGVCKSCDNLRSAITRVVQERDEWKTAFDMKAKESSSHADECLRLDAVIAVLTKQRNDLAAFYESATGRSVPLATFDRELAALSTAEG